MRKRSRERFPFLRANQGSKGFLKWYQEVIDNDKETYPPISG